MKETPNFYLAARVEMTLQFLSRITIQLRRNLLSIRIIDMIPPAVIIDVGYLLLLCISTKTHKKHDLYNQRVFAIFVSDLDNFEEQGDSPQGSLKGEPQGVPISAGR